MSRDFKICAHPNRKEIDALLTRQVSYSEIARRFEGISRDSVSRYANATRPCNGGSASPKAVIRVQVEKDDKERGLSGIRILKSVQKEVETRLNAQPPDALNGPVVAALRLQADISRMLGVGAADDGKAAINAYMARLVVEEAEDGS